MVQTGEQLATWESRNEGPSNRLVGAKTQGKWALQMKAVVRAAGTDGESSRLKRHNREGSMFYSWIIVHHKKKRAAY